MNFKEFYITEMPHVVKNGTEDSWSKNSDFWYGMVDVYRTSKLKEEYKKDFVYKVMKDSYNNFNIFCINPNILEHPIVIGVLQLRKEKVLKKYKYPQISWVAVHPNFRKKNIATGLYVAGINYFGGLVSDTSLTMPSTGGGSLNVWKTLAKSNYVYAYDGKLFKSIDCNDVVSDKYHKDDILFVVSKDKIKGAIIDE